MRFCSSFLPSNIATGVTIPSAKHRMAVAAFSIEKEKCETCVAKRYDTAHMATSQTYLYPPFEPRVSQMNKSLADVERI